MKSPATLQSEQLIPNLSVTRARLDNRLSINEGNQANATLNGVDPLPVALALLGRSVATYVRAQVSPSAIVHFAKRHPVLVSVGVAAALLTGPARILNMIKKVVTIFGVVH